MCKEILNVFIYFIPVLPLWKSESAMLCVEVQAHNYYVGCWPGYINTSTFPASHSYTKVPISYFSHQSSIIEIINTNTAFILTSSPPL